MSLRRILEKRVKIEARMVDVESFGRKAAGTEWRSWVCSNYYSHVRNKKAMESEMKILLTYDSVLNLDFLLLSLLYNAQRTLSKIICWLAKLTLSNR